MRYRNSQPEQAASNNWVRVDERDTGGEQERKEEEEEKAKEIVTEGRKERTEAERTKKVHRSEQITDNWNLLPSHIHLLFVMLRGTDLILSQGLRQRTESRQRLHDVVGVMC